MIPAIAVGGVFVLNLMQGTRRMQGYLENEREVSRYGAMNSEDAEALIRKLKIQGHDLIDSSILRDPSHK